MVGVYDVDNDEADGVQHLYNRQKQQLSQFVNVQSCIIDGGKKSYTDWVCTECKMQVDDDKDISRGSVCLDYSSI
jgi:hypothetical protein